MTLTLKLPEKGAAVFQAIPAQERTAYAIAVLRRDADAEMSPGDAADLEEACRAIAQSEAQIDSGETFSLEECRARSAAKWEHRGRAQQRAAQ